MTVWWNNVDKHISAGPGGTGFTFNTTISKEQVMMNRPIESIQAIIISLSLFKKKEESIKKQREDEQRRRNDRS